MTAVLDLVERLRRHKVPKADIRQAADELVRLRAVIKRQQTMIKAQALEITQLEDYKAWSAVKGLPIPPVRSNK
jgi:hypothetical protein